ALQQNEACHPLEVLPMERLMDRQNNISSSWILEVLPMERLMDRQNNISSSL
ncbi:hypothetical protein Tco_0426617, partial [Tanacetum coccineum]